MADRRLLAQTEGLELNGYFALKLTLEMLIEMKAAGGAVIEIEGHGSDGVIERKIIAIPVEEIDRMLAELLAQVPGQERAENN